MKPRRGFAALLVLESLACLWVLNAHLPGLISAPLPMPAWQEIAVVVGLVTGLLPLVLALTANSTRDSAARCYPGLTVGVGCGLWVALAGVQSREIPPPTAARLVVMVALTIPWLVLPALFVRSDSARRRVFIFWVAVGSYGVCELTVGEAIREKDWRILQVESDRYAIIVSDARGFKVAPHAKWHHVYSSDPEGYWGADRQVTYIANSRGLRDRELPIRKPNGVFRALALGDSFTLGEGVRVEDSWPTQLERTLRSRFATDRIEVINAGVNAYDTRQEQTHYQLNVRDYEADLVIVAMVWNDAQPGDPRGFGASFGLSTAALAQYLPLTDRIARTIAASCGYDGVASDPVAWRESFEALATLRRAVQADGARFLVAIYPSVRHLNNESLKTVYALQETFCLENGFPVFNAWPVFDSLPRQKWHVHAVDNHPNASAHRVFAEHLTEHIKAIGIR